MVDFKEKPKKFQRLKHKYRLVILNDDTFEEKVSLRLSQLNVFVVLGISSLDFAEENNLKTIKEVSLLVIF